MDVQNTNADNTANTDVKNIKLRIKFRKYGAIRFIGHLDVMRYFQKAIRRAGIDVAYSKGYSPHQIMSFASPLGVGLESNGEYMDVEVHSLISCKDIQDKLNAVAAPGIEVTSVKILPEDAGNAMASVAAASYSVVFRENRMPDLDISAVLPAFLSQNHIMITKQTKKGTRDIDLKEGIYELSWDKTRNMFSMLVDASSAGNIKPGQVIQALLEQNNCELQENALLITREDTYCALTKDGQTKLVPLDAIGYGDEEAAFE